MPKRIEYLHSCTKILIVALPTKAGNNLNVLSQKKNTTEQRLRINYQYTQQYG